MIQGALRCSLANYTLTPMHVWDSAVAPVTVSQAQPMFPSWPLHPCVWDDTKVKHGLRNALGAWLATLHLQTFTKGLLSRSLWVSS